MKVLVISVHPDDETLGCGGTILKHKKNGDEVNWIIFTEAQKQLGYSEKFILNREKQLNIIKERYKFNKIFNLGHSTTKLHLVDINVMIQQVGKIINDTKPEIIYMNNRSDIHTDHQIAANVLFSCTKSFRYPFIKKILMYECLSETEIAPYLPERLFVPNVYSEISEFIDEKIDIMKVYETEVQQDPLPRSINNIYALAKYRGSSCGVNYAEAFMLIRERF